MADEAPIKQIQNTMYDRMTFPSYEYQAFPRAVPVVDGVVQPTPYDKRNKAHPVVIVQNQGELDELMAGGAELVPVSEAAPDGAMRIESEEDIRKAFYIRADQAGAKIDKRLSVQNYEQELLAAEAAKAGKGDVV